MKKQQITNAPDTFILLTELPVANHTSGWDAKTLKYAPLPQTNWIFRINKGRLTLYQGQADRLTGTSFDNRQVDLRSSTTGGFYYVADQVAFVLSKKEDNV
ncbi:MAG: hypothetical protein K9I47_01860 [Bacteroidales bacterium]|nr:hypothetical protein [Bacteroidales bacterium]